MEKLIKQMMVDDPFYGFFITTLERRYTEQIERIAVRFTRSMNAELLINRKWFEQFDDETKINLIKHELLHLAFKHIILSKSFNNPKRFNTAADLEVNCYLGKLPADGCFCRDFGFPERQGTAYYYKKLTELAEQKKAEYQQQAEKQQLKRKPYNEEQVITDLKNGNKSMKKVLYKVTKSKAIGCVNRYCSNKAEAIQILKDSYKHVFDNINDFIYTGKGAFQEWLNKTIADNCTAVILKAGIEFPDITQTETEEDIELSEIPITVLTKAIQQLPSGFNLVFNRNLFEQLSGQELAEMLNTDANSVESYFIAAQNSLKTKIKELMT